MPEHEQDNENEMHFLVANLDALALVLISIAEALPQSAREAVAIVITQRAEKLVGIWESKGIEKSTIGLLVSQIELVCKELRADRPFDAKE